MGKSTEEASTETPNYRKDSQRRNLGNEMEIEFDFRKEQSGIFGAVDRPVAKVTLTNRGISIPEIFYVDSGADLTLVPRSIGEILKLDDPTGQETFDIKGIGEKGVPIVLRPVRMQIGNFQFQARIGWALSEDIPMLLGREEIFPLFDILFSKNRKTIFRK